MPSRLGMCGKANPTIKGHCRRATEVPNIGFGYQNVIWLAFFDLSWTVRWRNDAASFSGSVTWGISSTAITDCIGLQIRAVTAVHQPFSCSRVWCGLHGGRGSECTNGNQREEFDHYQLIHDSRPEPRNCPRATTCPTESLERPLQSFCQRICQP